MAFVVAIDGPAAAGKGTLARALAAHFGFAYL
ncbi:MAG: cytidylate kinase, partial [Rhodobacteraceae bacterium]|nr:cytidylate kinase [Paracoccaceae bacterium]